MENLEIIRMNVEKRKKNKKLGDDRHEEGKGDSLMALR